MSVRRPASPSQPPRQESPIGRVTALALAFLILAAPSVAAERTRLTIYTASQVEQVARTKAAIEAALPEVEAVFVRAPANTITQRVLDEGVAPQADMIVGLAATAMITIKRAGLLEPYRPAGAERLRTSFLDPSEPHSFTGMAVYAPVICLDPDRLREDRIARPTVWRDLLDPRLKGRIAMPDPVLSGTGYGLLAGWVQSMGEEQAWAFMDALVPSVSGYFPTGSGPCFAVAKGDYALGLGLDVRAAAQASGAAIESTVPLDRTGWDLEAFGILKGSAHLDLAKRVADWAASREANAVYAKTYAIVADPETEVAPAIALPQAESRLVRANLIWMAENRERLLAEWKRRYGTRAAPP